MLYDRDYMRGDDAGVWRSPVVILMVVLGLVFLAQCILGTFGGLALHQVFGLSYPAVRTHQYWRLVTYEFLHTAPEPWHLIFNGLGLWFFGRPVLEALGRRRFWQVYLGSGFVGALFELVFQAWHPTYYTAPTVGASACILGLVGVYCMIHAGQEILFFIYVIPVRMPAMVMFWVVFAFAVFGSIFHYGGTAHAAHLGGLLAGAGFAKALASPDPWSWLRRWLPQRPAPRAAEPEVPVPILDGGSGSGATRKAPRSPAPPSPPETSEDFMRREVDPILDKISAHGMQSLTEKERRILQRARERMRGDGR